MTTTQFKDATIDAKANIYFDGKVISHTAHDSSGRKLTLGLIFPGSYKFNTGAPERMIITSGRCSVVQGSGALSLHEAGSEFIVPGSSSFTISVEKDFCEYICIFE